MCVNNECHCQENWFFFVLFSSEYETDTPCFQQSHAHNQKHVHVGMIIFCFQEVKQEKGCNTMFHMYVNVTIWTSNAYLGLIAQYGI